MAWSRLNGAQAINRTSGLSVARDRQPEYDPVRGAKIEPHHLRSPAPLPIRPVPAQGQDLTGQQVGRLTVIGYYGRGGSGSRWVVRCLCGYYEVRSRLVLLDPAYAASAACRVCDYEREMLAGRATPPPIRHEHTDLPAGASAAQDDAPPLARLFRAVARMDADSTFSDLAAAAEIPRAQVRPLLDAMVAHGVLRLRADGWYEPGALTARGTSPMRAR